MDLSTILVTTPIFEGFDHAERDVLERSMVVADYPDGHTFIQERAPAADRYRAMYVIVNGKVLVTAAQKHANEYGVVRLMHPGEVFGIVALVSDGPRAATCRAAGPVKAAAVTLEGFNLL